MMDLLDLQRKLAPVLKPCASLYGSLMRMRRTYLEHSSSRYTCACPCVSVGNIAWGGTGKTPLIEWLMHWAAENQIHAAVLSRGYGAKIVNPPVRILPEHSPNEVGDEPLMLALSQPDIPVIADPVRRRSAAYAMEELHPDLVFLDDGFQHLALNRTLDLVLLRPEDVRGQWNAVIPAGSWREPASALRRAGAFLFKCSSDAFCELEPDINARLKRFAKPVFSFVLEPDGLRSVDGTQTMLSPPSDQKPYMLITGVGQPDQVEETVTGFMGYPPVKCLFRPDHHAYTAKEIDALITRHTMVICTAKDAVKLRMHAAPDFWYLQTSVRFGPQLWTDDTFPEWWSAWWRRNAQQPRH